jgi:tungstate transport system substrate-binding protein
MSFHIGINFSSGLTMMENGLLISLGSAFLVVAIVAGLACNTAAPEIVKLATTTSAANTGLLDYLLPEFENDTGIHVDYIATGTGKALMHGRNGDVDVVLVHAPAAEAAFVKEGFGVERVPVMWNDFVILGPPDDPAALSQAEDVADAMTRLSASEARFVSRGDDSGTHKKELQIWEQTGVKPAGTWYVEAGQGMGACLTMASNLQAYVLTDRGTYLARVDDLDLTVAFEDDRQLVNPYAIIAVNTEKHPHANRAGTERLIEWMTSPRARDLIAAYRVNGRELFHLFE